MSEVALLLLIVAAGTGAELCLARAVKHAGEVPDFRPSTFLRILGAALHVQWLWLGIALLATYFVALLTVLSVEDVSFVIPVTALGSILGPLGGKFFLAERVDAARWIGVLLVGAGVVLVIAGRP